MHETGDESGEAEVSGDRAADAEARERTAEHIADAARPAADRRLRTFRTGSDLPFLVLHDEPHGDRSMPRHDDDRA